MGQEGIQTRNGVLDYYSLQDSIDAEGGGKEEVGSSLSSFKSSPTTTTVEISIKKRERESAGFTLCKVSHTGERELDDRRLEGVVDGEKKKSVAVFF